MRLRCHCNADHKKISSLFYKAVVVIVQVFAYGNVVYVQTWEVMSLKKTPRAT